MNENTAIQGCLRIVTLADRRDLAETAADWFSSKWGVPRQAYLDSMEASFTAIVPRWYLCLDGERIAAGMGVIENDFHDRPDLTPNVCAVFTEPDYRNRGLAGRLLDHVCKDMAAHGIDTLYLLTDHKGFYERYGWEFYCMAQGDDPQPSRMYIHRQKEA
ncbi:MAG: GNAT family N-acetyltransferase [Oscillospiraceae bacterium]|nr:GNAT family N-acetyltransferase [Oscillospiraceae bacterium]